LKKFNKFEYKKKSAGKVWAAFLIFRQLIFY
jgi:hypothetical protein